MYVTEVLQRNDELIKREETIIPGWSLRRVNLEHLADVESCLMARVSFVRE